ncbi:MAG: penicillin-binding transpeptidase domain-containing protein, partial [Candidatus Promineifilaceae bacterium]
MNASQQRRLGFIAVLMTFGLGAVLYRLVTFQLLDAGTYAELGRQLHNWNVVDSPDRGIIYDRNMTVLAGNSADYRLGASPSLVLDADEVAASIAPILQLSRHELVAKLSSDQLYEVIAPRIPAAEADAVRELDLAGLQLDPLPRRIYPQDKLMCHVLGFTDLDGRGGAGLEGFFQAELAGISAQETINISPLTTQASVIATEGVDLVLTVDRTVQYVVEEHLKRALQTYGAQSGTIIVMDPRTGAILAMANQPCYDPYEFYSTDRALLLNPA